MRSLAFHALQTAGGLVSSDAGSQRVAWLQSSCQLCALIALLPLAVHWIGCQNMCLGPDPNHTHRQRHTLQNAWLKYATAVQNE